MCCLNYLLHIFLKYQGVHTTCFWGVVLFTAGILIFLLNVSFNSIYIVSDIVRENGHHRWGTCAQLEYDLLTEHFA